MKTTTATASIATPTTAGVTGALDCDVTVTIDDVTLDAEVTFARDHDGRWIPYGPAVDYWMSGNLERAVRDLSDEDTRAVVDAIVEAVRPECVAWERSQA